MTDSAEGSGLFRNIAIAVVTGVVTYAGTLYFNAPQEGSINYLLMKRLGVVEQTPPSLDCPGFKQDIFYGDARKVLQECGWFASTKNVMYIKHDTTRRVAIDTGWSEAQHCIGTGLANCRFIFHKSPDGPYMMVYTSGMNYIVDSYSTSWEPIPSSLTE